MSLLCSGAFMELFLEMWYAYECRDGPLGWPIVHSETPNVCPIIDLAHTVLTNRHLEARVPSGVQDTKAN